MKSSRRRRIPFHGFRVAFQPLLVPNAIHLRQHGIQDDNIGGEVAVFNTKCPKVNEQREDSPGRVPVPRPRFEKGPQHLPPT